MEAPENNHVNVWQNSFLLPSLVGIIDFDVNSGAGEVSNNMSWKLLQGIDLEKGNIGLYISYILLVIIA
jgi:hypothetical protein